jgi:hypothetical protein
MIDSEFGKAERDEARAKKYTPRKRAADDRQWVLRVSDRKSANSAAAAAASGQLNIIATNLILCVTDDYYWCFRKAISRE